jgi:prepilin-type processing-associated H-X9-DG protein
VIVVLIALVLGVTVGVRRAAAKAACANNLRQLWHGLFAYHQENGRLPGSDAHKSFSELPSFVDVLMKRPEYTASLFICPTSALEHPTSYELSFAVVGQPFSRTRGDVILASETGTCIQCHNRTSEGVGHGSLANHLFFDGHVEALPKAPDPPARPPGTPPDPPMPR